MTKEKVLGFICNENLVWNKVRSQPCISLFIGDYLIKMIKWNRCGLETISIIVDNFEEGLTYVYEEDFTKNDIEFEEILNRYHLYISTARCLLN